MAFYIAYGFAEMGVVLCYITGLVLLCTSSMWCIPMYLIQVNNLTTELSLLSILVYNGFLELCLILVR